MLTDFRKRVIRRGKFGYKVKFSSPLFNENNKNSFPNPVFICSMLNTISCNLLRKNIIMSFLRMIRIREIAGRPIAHWISPKFIEDLPLDGDESFQQSLIGIRDMLQPMFIKNMNVKGMKCHFQEFNLYFAMKDLIFFFRTTWTWTFRFLIWFEFRSRKQFDEYKTRRYMYL